MATAPAKKRAPSLKGDDADVIKDFHAHVNMTPRELERWLQTDESKAVGWTRDGSATSESVGHESGRHIVRILEKRRSEYTDDDIAHMHKVLGYIKRHCAQGPKRGDVAHSRWASSLKNWGHDPTK